MGNPLFGGGKLALVVDDHEDFCLMMDHILTTFGFQVVCAANGYEALATMQREPPAVVLLDLFMPHMDGIEVLRQLRGSKTPMPPTIAVTGDIHVAMYDASSAAQALGAKAVLLKPFTREQLAKAISFVLETGEPSVAESC